MESKQKLYKPIIVKKEVDDEHYYYVDGEFYPSVTKILHESMPMPIGLKTWIGDVGNEKAEQKLNKAAVRGSLLHDTCENLLRGEEIDLKPFDRSDQKCIVSFVKWFHIFQPYDIKIEQIVASALGFAGTLDIKCKIDPEIIKELGIKPQIDSENWIIDMKTSRNIYLAHKLQITAYEIADNEMTGEHSNRAILHLNPLLKTNGYTFDTNMTIKKKPITIHDFMTVFDMYLMLNGGEVPQPKLIDVYPETIRLFENAKD